MTSKQKNKTWYDCFGCMYYKPKIKWGEDKSKHESECFFTKCIKENNQ